MWPNPQFPADLVTFTEEICNGKLHFLCSIISFGGTWFSGWPSWEQTISSTASSFSAVVAVRGQPEPFCLSMVPNASSNEAYHKSLHWSSIPGFLWIIFPYFICYVSYFMIMFDNRLICVRKKHYWGIRQLTAL